MCRLILFKSQLTTAPPLNCHKHKHSLHHSYSSNITLFKYWTRTSERLALDKQNPNHHCLLGSEKRWTNYPPRYVRQQHRCICQAEPSKTYRQTLPQLRNINIKYRVIYYKQYFITLTICSKQHHGADHHTGKYYCNVHYDLVPSVLWRCWLGGRKSIRPVKNWVVGCWRGCLGWGADVHIAQQMPLPLTISCSSKSRLVLTFLVLPFWYLLTGWSRTSSRRAVKRLCVCVCSLWP